MLLDKLNKMTKYVIIGLDHNLDLLKSGLHKNTQDFLERNLVNKMLPCITKPTRVTHSSASLIDNIFSSELLYQYSSKYIVIDDISDHLPCLCMFENMFPTPLPDKYVFKRKLIEKNLEKINFDINNID